MTDYPAFEIEPDPKDQVCQQFDKIAAYHCAVAWNSVARHTRTGSPIERDLMMGLIIRCKWEMLEYKIITTATKLADLASAARLASALPRGPLVIFKEHPVENFRADFLLAMARKFGDPSSVMFIGVECDGHQYHDKTREQAQRDKERDRRFLLSGVPVMRFTGSEIFRAPVACGAQAITPFLDERNRLDNLAVKELLAPNKEAA